MYFNKIQHPANFVFERPTDALVAADLGDDVHRIRSRRHARWKNPSQAVLTAPATGRSAHRVVCGRRGGLKILNSAGRTVLSGVPGATFGRNGDAWLVQFRLEPRMQFYGLGEHSRAFEKSGQRVKFWNTDLIADFAWDEVRLGHPNPMYVDVPWVIVKRGNFFLGLLVHHPGAVFMDLGSNFVWDESNRTDRDRRSFYVGAPDGEPELYLIVGPTLAGLTRKFQRLVGCTPLPPLWALGYQQCRWGYAGPRDLEWLDRELRRRRIPCDGLWLDIDHMDRLKVFTFAPRLWGGPARTRRTLASLASRGRRVVPILDPGVKVEPGYRIHDEGVTQRRFCLGPTGRPYVGFAWPGQTYFPDFSRADVRAWWAAHVAEFARTGAGAAWIDMNDPSTGAAEMDDMRFDRGRQPHAAYHNQYALGMAQATRAGFLAARPEERPFVLSRSAYLSSSRFAAVWTGDNLSNWHHLRLAIPVTLGLALSGIPFCGPDVCGFGLDVTRELAIAWHKLQFLFPFFRNHNSRTERPQEPWQFGAAAERILTHYLRLRYKFLPYLYQLFITQEERGDAILRPLFHDFPDRAAQPLAKISDQFLVGPSLMQAPLVIEGADRRGVVLPGGTAWFSLATGRCHDGGQTIEVQAGEDSTPLFVRDGTLLALRPGVPHVAAADLRTIELHAFLRPGTRGGARTTYSADDGISFAYRRGERSTVDFRARLDDSGTLEISAASISRGYGPLSVRIVTYPGVRRVVFVDGKRRQPLATERFAWRATGRELAGRRSETLTF
ncbi:MAG TPA: TIM-barrel domain-containing protein [Opitutaceae bacterium]|nr:TIM-barrel domain-containing protein [Opitutaceae bacterium]